MDSIRKLCAIPQEYIIVLDGWLTWHATEMMYDQCELLPFSNQRHSNNNNNKQNRIILYLLSSEAAGEGIELLG